MVSSSYCLQSSYFSYMFLVGLSVQRGQRGPGKYGGRDGGHGTVR